MTIRLAGNAATISGNVISNFMMGDEIQIADETPAQSDVLISGDKLVYGPNHAYSITITNLGPGRYVSRTIYDSNHVATGTDVRLQENAHNDFSGIGRSDILWRADDGTVTDWIAQSNGSFVANTHFSSTVPTDWHIVGTGDFNGDGLNDILWRNVTTGQISDWLGQSNGNFVSNSANLSSTVPTDWQIVGIGDFTGNGHDDILWRNATTGQVSDWLGQSNGGFVDNSANLSSTVPTDWQIVGTGDFNGDGRADILWRNATTGQVSDWLGQSNGGFVSNSANLSSTVPTNWHIVSIGDFNGDAIDDILWQNSTTGQLSDWLGQPNGGFIDNSAVAATANTAAWHVQEPFVHFL